MIIHSRANFDKDIINIIGEDEFSGLVRDKLLDEMKGYLNRKLIIEARDNYKLDNTEFNGSLAVLTPNEYNKLKEIESMFYRLRELEELEE